MSASLLRAMGSEVGECRPTEQVLPPSGRLARDSEDETVPAAPRCGVRTRAAAVCGSLLCAWGALLALSRQEGHQRSLRVGHPPRRPLLAAGRSSLEEKAEEQQVGYCGKVEDDVDYSAYNLYRVRNITSASDCCAKCRQDPDCRAWTWGKARHVRGLSEMCYLKGLAPGEVVMKKPNGNTTSGLPFWINKDKAASLFCFSPVLMSENYSKLLLFQHKRGAGIFGCEEYAVYSAEPMKAIPGVRCGVVHGWANCSARANGSACGEVSTFVLIWRKVVAEGRFRFHKWTVKVEPSAVFLPARLRTVLRGIDEPSTGLFLNSCKAGVKAPLTVFSRRAVQVYALGYVRCEAAGGGDFDDKYLDQCLARVLQIGRQDAWSLISDPSCQSHDLTCGGSNYIGFYPFDSVEDYDRCLSAAHWAPPQHALVPGPESAASDHASSRQG